MEAAEAEAEAARRDAASAAAAARREAAEAAAAVREAAERDDSEALSAALEREAAAGAALASLRAEFQAPHPATGKQRCRVGSSSCAPTVLLYGGVVGVALVGTLIVLASLGPGTVPWAQAC